ncbi:glycosyl transferase [Terrihabitans soli]|uniref:Peptide O-xylosyltransferase n=1 Tax=Terrihabitans soli TaxID=708113 RepID=A0A6S6QY06_9HYPH|nr:beta-1,6-N-acetylglucosaminyltransferase [Terrihabitans soli]BCJ91911.1 glycosyl transferase [Terrihabitans soli]
MRVAFQINIHHMPDQFRWLFSAIYNETDLFLVHVNKRSDQAFYDQIESLVAGLDNVRLMTRQPIVWGGWSMVDCELRGIREALADNETWDYFVRLSGQDYPLCTYDERVRGLRRLNGRSAIGLSAGPIMGEHADARTQRFHFEWQGKLRYLPLISSRLLGKAPPLKGNAWHALSREFCEWLATAPETKRLARRLRFSKIPDEAFMHNLIADSPFADRWLNEGTHLEFWQPTKPSPDIVRMSNLSALCNSQRMFARKFDAGEDSDVMNFLSARIGAPGFSVSDLLEDGEPPTREPRVAASLVAGILGV